MKLAIVGGGAMGEAIITAVLSSKLTTPAEIGVSEISDVRRAYLSRQHGVQTFAESGAAIEGAEIALFAIKPQDAALAAAGLRGGLGNSTIVSIMAGVTIDKLVTLLGSNRVVRAMPNTPSQVGQGMTVWTATPQVDQEARKAAASIFGAMGDEAFVEEERYLDMATALSGSGPAYVFLFMEALVDAGVHLGLTRQLANQMALKTVVGSALYAERNDGRLAELRNQVTSPGGTTAEALRALEQAGFRSAIQNAVLAAYNRSVELGKKD